MAHYRKYPQQTHSLIRASGEIKHQRGFGPFFLPGTECVPEARSGRVPAATPVNAGFEWEERAERAFCLLSRLEVVVAPEAANNPCICTYVFYRKSSFRTFRISESLCLLGLCPERAQTKARSGASPAFRFFGSCLGNPGQYGSLTVR